MTAAIGDVIRCANVACGALMRVVRIEQVYVVEAWPPRGAAFDNDDLTPVETPDGDARQARRKETEKP